MRFHLRRLLRCSRVRENATSLPSQNRCLVSLLLFLLAFTGTWNLALWLATDADISYEYFSDKADDNSTQSIRISHRQFLANVTTIISVLYKLNTIKTDSNISEAAIIKDARTLDNLSTAKLTSAPSSLARSLPTFAEIKTLPSKERSRLDITVATTLKKVVHNSSHLLDINNFKFLHSNTTACDGEPFLIVVHSAVPNYERRQLIRQTWGRKRPVFFMLGSSRNSTQESFIREENRAYGDIVRGSFVDTYRNLTYKHIMSLQWALTNCPSTSYVIKVDDDVIVNVNLLQKYIASLAEVDDVSSSERDNDEPLIICDVVNGAYVKRSYRSKWRLGFLEYQADTYPSYCNGWAIVYSMSAVSRILNGTESVPFLWVDDVYVTGLVTQNAGLKLTQIDEKFIGSAKDLPKLIKGSGMDEFVKNVVFGPPQLSLEDMKSLWSLVSKHEKKKKKKINTGAVILPYF